MLLEIEGGMWSGGRHFRGAGASADMTKYNRAAAMGIRTLRCTPQMLEGDEIFDDLAEAMTYLVVGDGMKEIE